MEGRVKEVGGIFVNNIVFIQHKMHDKEKISALEVMHVGGENFQGQIYLELRISHANK